MCYYNYRHTTRSACVLKEFEYRLASLVILSCPVAHHRGEAWGSWQEPGYSDLCCSPPRKLCRKLSILSSSPHPPLHDNCPEASSTAVKLFPRFQCCEIRYQIIELKNESYIEPSVSCQLLLVQMGDVSAIQEHFPRGQCIHPPSMLRSVVLPAPD